MIKAVTGTKDILPIDIPKWRYLEGVIRTVFGRFNYKEIRTPVFEETVLFSRGIGEETDIVGKEMYTFLDKSRTSLTLKPEMTASVVRAFIEHSLIAKQPLVKLFYISPMFRQERPQAGRLREFHQFGAEALGGASPLLDAEMIQMSFHILKELGLKDLNVKINSLGVPASREEYRKVLHKYIKGKKSKLSEESRRRLDKNILRIFDSKDENDNEVLKDAPVLLEYIDQESKTDFDEVKKLLERIGIKYEVDPRLVRGLDYYTKTTFEITSGKVGAQNALCGGGRYDLLAEELGGKPAPGIGFAAGMERILLACEAENSFRVPDEKIDVYLIKLDKELTSKIFEIATILRRKNLRVDFDYLDRSVKAQMREANRLNAKYVLIVGGEEFKTGHYKLKNMSSGDQKLLPVSQLNSIIIV
jgi:histidyl-tRNA synthetase